MEYLDEYYNMDTVHRYADEIIRITTRPWIIMEICGGQTHSIVKNGIDKLLPDNITLLHGPGCPVCVTPVELIDKAVEIALRENIIFCSFGDMLRVPGTSKDLLSVKAEGGDVRVVYSPIDSLKIAERNPDKEIVFFAIGFETTAPANALTIRQAKLLRLSNFSMLTAMVLVPPAIETILASPGCMVQGFLAAGHVCTVMGYKEYEEISKKYNVPIVVTGFEPLDILQAVHMTVSQLEAGSAKVTNQYSRAVTREGNIAAQSLMNEVFDVVDRKWRGLGEIPESGLALSEPYMEFDAEKRFNLKNVVVDESTVCISGLILRGEKKPFDCTAFGNRCTPEHPLGATMVSSEGACAAYYRYRRHSLNVLKTLGE
jgi:hydrogenase expression/formation protein HypD